MKKLIDLSHTVEEGLVTYKGLPAPIICDYLSREASREFYAEGTTFQIGMIEMCSNTGTYLDSPFHRYEDGRDLSELELDAVASIPGVKIIIPDGVSAVTHELLKPYDVKDKAVLIETRWSQHWNSEPYYEGHPHLTEDAAILLRDRGAILVGIDSYNIDDTHGKERPVHSTLLGAEILIVEHLCNLEQIPDRPFRFYAVPVKIKGFGTFPVRAFVEVEVE